MKNFRKYREDHNFFTFVNADGIKGKSISTDKEGKSDLDKDIDVASATTLIVGKNNTGKTSVIQALLKIIKNNENYGLQVRDINFHYLENCFQHYLESFRFAAEDVEKVEFEPPVIEFVITIALEKDSDDLVTNLVPFMLLGDVDREEIEIVIKYEISEKDKFKDAVLKACKQVEERDAEKRSNEKGHGNRTRTDFQIMFRELEKVPFQMSYYQRYIEEGEKEPKIKRIESNFRLSNLMDIKCISANNVKKDSALTEAFNRIISYRYNNIVDSERQELDKNIDRINDDLTQNIREHHHAAINNAIGEIVASDAVKVNLSTDITEEKLVRSFLLYEYEEKGLNIPENQFGLGYTHLVMIIAELIDYMEHYPEEKNNSKINLIAIEEPESFMHPQMQELFIKNINDALKKLIEDKQRKLNSQLIVTTHSSHILNSKIHMGNSFDDICYVYAEKRKACVVNLNDASVMPSEKETEKNDFAFLKKHIKYKVSELFFADAVILVEGFAEETILPFYLEQDKRFNKRYISIFGISGAHAFIYENLLKKLKIPALIITDLDIRRTEDKNNEHGKQKDEKVQKDYTQVTTLAGQETSNKTINHFQKTYDISNICPYMEVENIRIVYQRKIGKYYPASFEEAFILTNAENKLLNNVLKAIKPQIYKKIVQSDNITDYKQNIEQSYKWQKKLSGDKGKFASELLYQLIVQEDLNKRPALPNYILDGLEWLINKLEEGEIHGFKRN